MSNAQKLDKIDERISEDFGDLVDRMHKETNSGSDPDVNAINAAQITRAYLTLKRNYDPRTLPTALELVEFVDIYSRALKHLDV